jgi:Putative rhamnosyl transferase
MSHRNVNDGDQVSVSQPDVDHVMLTRFNLPTTGVEGVVRAREGWLRNRVELFERYCAPSVARQARPVRWIIYLDPESPRWLLDRLAPLVERGLFRPILRASVSREELLSDIRETVPSPQRALVTTNLDNDDGLASDFSARVTSAPCPHDRAALYVTRGLIKSPRGLFLRRDPVNAFPSVRESWDQPVTAWSEYHNEFPRVMPAIRLGGPPGWLQVVHGENVSNRVRGRLVSPTSYLAGFGHLLDDVEAPSRRDRWKDDLLYRPGRFVRDTARATTRSTALSLLGKERYSDAKLLLARSQQAVRQLIPGTPRTR